MKISVKLLTIYRKKLPEETTGNTCTLEVPAGTRVGEVLQQFDIPDDSSSVVLVNGFSPEGNQPLQEGDEVCVYSAMAGG
jgi:sulfur carrier protein ThiS